MFCDKGAVPLKMEQGTLSHQAKVMQKCILQFFCTILHTSGHKIGKLSETRPVSHYKIGKLP